MSSIKIFIVIVLTSVISLSSCEDTKKQPENLSEKIQIQVNDSVKTIISSEEKKDTLPKFPKITDDNVVEFLTDYGKQNPETKVQISTRLGNIEIELFEDTPLHRANFIYLIKQKYFDETYFHRIVPNFIIQGGNSDNASTNKKRFALGQDYRLPAEIIPGRKHTKGTVSGAKEYRKNPDKKSAPFEFFIFLGPQSATSHLNGNYTIFGKVTKGMNVVEEIANLEASDDDWPMKNVPINAKVLH